MFKSVLMLQNERLFSAAEEEQLMSVFGLTEENLALVLDSCCYVFEQVHCKGLATRV